MKLKVVAPIHYMYEDPRYVLPAIIKLDNGLIFTKFNKDLIDVVTGFFEDLYSGYEIKDLQNCKFCVVYDFDSDVESENDAQSRVHHFIESLRIIRPTVATCSTFIFSYDRKGALVARGASAKTNSVFLTYGEDVGASHFITTDTKKIQFYYKCIADLYGKYSGVYNRVLNAFIFYQLGYLTHYAKLRIVPFATVLESLFNTSEQEVGYSLRVRCAAFLGESTAKRNEISQKVKAIYELRSLAVHGASLPKKVLKDPVGSNKIIRDAEDLCRQSLRKIFREKLVDTFSQTNDKLIIYLDNLVLE